MIAIHSLELLSHTTCLQEIETASRFLLGSFHQVDQFRGEGSYLLAQFIQGGLNSLADLFQRNKYTSVFIPARSKTTRIEYCGDTGCLLGCKLLNWWRCNSSSGLPAISSGAGLFECELLVGGQGATVRVRATRWWARVRLFERELLSLVGTGTADAGIEAEHRKQVAEPFCLRFAL